MIFKAAILMLALVGFWYVVQSYQHDELKENMAKVVSDYSRLAGKVTNPNERATLNQKFGEINNILQKYQ